MLIEQGVQATFPRRLTFREVMRRSYSICSSAPHSAQTAHLSDGRTDHCCIPGCEYYYNPALRKKKEEEKKQIASNLGTDVSSTDFTQFIKLLRMSGVLDGDSETLLQAGLSKQTGSPARNKKRPNRPGRPNRPRSKRPRPRPRPRPVIYDYDYYDYDYAEDQASSRPAVISKNHKAELQAEVSPDRR